MVTNEKLEKYKQQVEETSKKQYQIIQEREKLENDIDKKEQESLNTQIEMEKIIRSVIEQSVLANAQERELLQDKLDKFSFKQQQMNEQIIRLNDIVKVIFMMLQKD